MSAIKDKDVDVAGKYGYSSADEIKFVSAEELAALGIKPIPGAQETP